MSLSQTDKKKFMSYSSNTSNFKVFLLLTSFNSLTMLRFTDQPVLICHDGKTEALKKREPFQKDMEPYFAMINGL